MADKSDYWTQKRPDGKWETKHEGASRHQVFLILKQKLGTVRRTSREIVVVKPI